MIQAEPDATKNLESLNGIKVRGSDGEMAPISQFVSLKKIYGPDVISRFNLYTSIQVMVSPAAGYSSGQALQAIAEVANDNLPAGFGYELEVWRVKRHRPPIRQELSLCSVWYSFTCC